MDHFVGLPHAEDGYDRTGASCYGLVCIAYYEDLGVTLPKIVNPAEWQLIDAAQARPYDVILMREHPWHVGLVVRRGLMLHMPEGQTSVVEPYTTGRHARRVEGFYRHASKRVQSA